jgi:2-oxoglutarate ferredoxin oxidoreductase subunit beta
MKKVFQRPESLTEARNHYCPGCSHGIIHRLLAECMDEMNIREKTIGICPVGCSVLAYDYFNCDMLEAAHGRAPAIATAIKRLLPDRYLFTYQGDGDLASIGMAEIVHASARGEKITVIFVNNTLYGMTGGQMAPTTLLGQVTTTSPYGRKVENEGYPMKMAELLSSNEGSAYICRTAVNNPANINRTKRAIKKALQVQEKGLGFSMVEILSACPTNWGLSPVEALKWMENNMIPYYPLGEFKVKEEQKGEAILNSPVRRKRIVLTISLWLPSVPWIKMDTFGLTVGYLRSTISGRTMKKLIMSFWKLMSVFWKAEIKIKSVFIYHRWI